MLSLKQTWQQQRQQRQQEVVQRQRQVQEMLVELRQSRQDQADQVRQELQTFHQQLQKQTQNFLSLCAANRTLMSQQLNQELDGFRWQLHSSVAALRQILQAQLRQLRADAQNQLHSHPRKRLQSQLELMQNLVEYVEDSHAEVQTQSAEFGMIRQAQAQQLRQMLRRDGDRRKAEVAELFRELSNFRAELRTYCTELHQLVWSDAVLPAPATSGIPVCSEAAFLETENLEAVGAIVASSSLSIEVTEAPQTEEAVEVDLDEKKDAALPSARVIELSETAKASEVADSSAQTHLRELKDSKEPISLEELVYIYLSESGGASLTGIETALTINRFQSVQALRSLIRKGLVTQRDRLYLIQEDVKL
jgi:cytochrome c556